MKKICFFLIIFLYQTFSYAKTTENIEFNHKYLSNYFSAIISINNQDDKDSLKYLNNTKSLVKTHESYLENYLISLVLNNKIDIAFNKAIQLKVNETNFFEAKVLLALNSINKKDFSNAMLTLEQMDEVPLDTLELIIKETLKDYLDTITFKKMDKNEDVQFGEIDKIKKIFQSCYLGERNTDLLFEELVIKDTEDFSRYIFFYINYLAQIKDFNKINELQNKIDYTNSSILIAQAKQWIENKRYDKITSAFSCKNEHHIISEFLFLISNLYSSQELYKKSNFYIHLSNYLNPEFNFNNSLLAENYIINKKFDLALKSLNFISEEDLIFSWYKNKKKSSIIKKQENETAALNFLEKKFDGLKTNNIKILYDMGGIYKSFEKYDEAIKIYSKLLDLLDNRSKAYADILYRRGGSFERIGDYETADKDLLESLNITRENPYVLNYLAYSWLERNYKIELSMEMLKEAYDLRKNDPYITDSLGWGYYLINDFENAEKYLKKAVELMPYDPIVNDHYGDILWMLNRKIQARYFWNNVLNLEETDDEMKIDVKKKIIYGIEKT